MVAQAKSKNDMKRLYGCVGNKNNFFTARAITRLGKFGPAGEKVEKGSTIFRTRAEK